MSARLPNGFKFMIGLLVSTAIVSACSGTSSLPGLGAENTAGFCKVADRLAEVATLLAPDAVEDPATFDDEFRSAVDEYLAELDLLATRAPADVEKNILLLMSAVDQYKFAAAIEAKEPVDIYIAKTCGPPPSTTTTA